MRARRRLFELLLLLSACFVVYKVLNLRSLHQIQKEGISNEKVKMRKLRSFKRDMAEFKDLEVMKELPVPNPPVELLIEPSKLKRREKHREFSLYMIIMIKSHSNNSERRDFIRKTWGQRNHIEDLSFDIVFILGTTGNQKSAVKLESENHGDILQINYNETYENLAFKTLAGMQWATDNFPKSYFYASMDDDILPNFRKISRHIHEIIETELDLRHQHSLQDSSSLNNMESLESFLSTHDLPIYCGFGYRVKARPKRNDTSKWHLSEKDYPLKRYPPYCFGGFYAITISLMSKLHSLAQKLPIFWIDDIWLTGFVRVKYFSSHLSNCHYCNRSNTTLGIWTEVPDDFAGAITGDIVSLHEEWIKISLNDD